MSVCLWDIVDSKGISSLSGWAHAERLNAADRAALNGKLDLLTQLGFDYAMRTGIVRGPLAVDRHIYKLRAVAESRTFLLFLCCGPLEPTASTVLSATVLSAALEVDGHMHPPTSLQVAQAARQALIMNPKLRVLHERF